MNVHCVQDTKSLLQPCIRRSTHSYGCDICTAMQALRELMRWCMYIELLHRPAVSQTPAARQQPLLMWTHLPHGPAGRCQLARCEGPLLGLLPVQVPLPCTRAPTLVKGCHSGTKYEHQVLAVGLKSLFLPHSYSCISTPRQQSKEGH